MGSATLDTPQSHSGASTGPRPGSEAHVQLANSLGLCSADTGALQDLKGETRAIAKGAHVRLREECPQFAVLVLSGLLFRYAQTRDGSRQVLALYFPGQWACVEAFLSAPLAGEIQALTRTKVRLFPRGEVHQLLENNPRVLRSLMIESLFQTRVQSAWLTRNGIMPAVGSLAHFLCEVVVRSGSANSDGTAFWPFPFTQQIIAETLGLTPVHVNRMLRELRERRLVEVTHGTLRVNNLDELAIAEFDPRYLQLRSTSASDRAENEDLIAVMKRPVQTLSCTGRSI